MKNVVWLLAVIVAMLLGYGWGSRGATSAISSTASDTITYTDTIRDTIPVPKDSIILRWKIVQVPVIDTITSEIRDSIYTVLPITQKEYADSSYHAWVSGFEPSLDSIYVFPKTTIITNTQNIISQKRWGIGIQAGMGYNGKITPYVGIGVTYNIWNF